jgi:DNA-directed RNA polymerase specialized sigma24 family protein
MSSGDSGPGTYEAGGRGWVPADVIGQAEAALAPEEADQDGDAEQWLLADQLLVQAVVDQGLDGPRHQAFERELIQYAIPVLRRLVSSGQIVIRCHQLGRPLGGLNESHRFTSHDLDDFAQEMIVRALALYTKAVFVDRKWTPKGGASLSTYFINGCIRHFPDIYRKWLRHRMRHVLRGLDLDPDITSMAADPAAMAAEADQAARLLLQLPGKDLREVMALRAVGYTVREATAGSGMTPKSAEGRLARFRKNLSKGADPLGSAGGAGKEGIGGGCSDDAREA